jgi:hypothetical protein
MSQAEDLERLARLLDEGKLTPEEFEAAKRELLGSGESVPATQAPAGWYNDPSGAVTHQAYWNGERWTGDTRPGPQAALGVKQRRSGCLVIALVVGALLIVGFIVALVAVQLAGNEVSEIFSNMGSPVDGETAPTASGGSDRITLEGEGDGDTESFSLSGGSYTIVTEVGNDCFYSFTLRDVTDGSRVEDITSMDEAGSTTVSLHGIEAGTYYVGVITGPAPSCPWSQRWTSS